MQIGSALVTGAQALEGVQPGKAAFDDPAGAPEAGAVGDAASCNPRGDTSRAQLPPVLVVVVATIGEQLPRLAPWPAASSPDRWHGVDQEDQLGDVVAVAAGQGDCQRNAAGVADQVVLAAGTAAVDR